MEKWRDKLNKLLNGDLKLFETDYIHGSTCRYKKNGRWVKAKIDMDNKVIYDLKGNILRRCS